MSVIQRISLYILLVASLAVACLLVLSVAAEAQEQPDIIEVDTTDVERFIGRTDEAPQTATLTVDVPAGTYSVLVDTSDAYDGRADVGNRDEYDKTQSAEVVCLAGGTCTLDLEDSVDAAESTQVVGTVQHDGGRRVLPGEHVSEPEQAPPVRRRARGMCRRRRRCLPCRRIRHG